ncbi:LOW QUALITY PROTEIN: hypothetical protein TorRG33x02_280170 [Trema orientale]|uniref:Uncharacterized protein n=1 Tax=Trema orientale TaxID=63057 RepID=A0A2P5CM84_TREOI|nr:LOW QUALITY PROTEIN: hypothetical protein TorRG33x02_280170 [Trema orientale]
MVEIYTTQLQSQTSSSASRSSISAPPHINESLIIDEVLGIRRRVGLKLRGAASTSFTVASLPKDPFVSDSELRDVFNQTQSY